MLGPHDEDGKMIPQKMSVWPPPAPAWFCWLPPGPGLSMADALSRSSALFSSAASTTTMVRRLLALRHRCALAQELGSLFATGRAVEGGVRRSRYTRPSSAGASVSFSSPFHSSSSIATANGLVARQHDHTYLHPASSLQRHGDTIGSCRQLSSSSSPSGSSLRDAEEIEQMKTQIARNGKRMTPEGVNDGGQLLRQLIEEQMAGNKLVGLDAEFINGTLNSYQVLSERAAEQAWRGGKRRPDVLFAKKADDLLAFVEQACANDPTLSPGSKSYSMVVDAYAKIGDPERAEAVLMRLEKLWKSGNEKVEPDTILYGSVIDAWAKSGRREAPKRATAILKHMEKLNQQGHEDVRPCTICYSAVIDAWAKSREKGAAQRAEGILNDMLKLQEAGREDCRPNTTSFTAVIDAWARSRDAAAPRRAEALLEKMEYLYRQGNEDACPNTVSYSAVINAWAKSREKGAAQRAEAILNHMLELYEGGREDCRSNTTSFNSVIDAWAKSRDKNAYEHASKLFQQMQSMGKAAKPNVLAYTSLINALAVSSVPDKATKAFGIFLEMENMANVSPDTFTFGAVMKACAKTSGNREAKRKALRVALEAFDKLRRSSHLSSANPMMYDPLFITIANASKGKEYAKLVTEIFKFCCQDGVLNDWILQNLRRNSPREVFENLIGHHAYGGGDVSVADLPPEWSRNAKMRR